MPWNYFNPWGFHLKTPFFQKRAIFPKNEQHLKNIAARANPKIAVESLQIALRTACCNSK